MGHIVSVFSVSIRSVFLRYYQYHTEGKLGGTFGIKKGAVSPFFLKRGATAPFLRSYNPLLEKRWEERGDVYEKGGNDPDRNTENPANLIPAKYQYQKNCW